ncbi:MULTISPECIES: MFS transporter [unclassified Pseudonocardia]|uniref:CynX/NimT family MFS transporter n=1 Tax=Pseudonocardia sp. Ae707_Ps1 TaxID=1885572 RepID=UPI00095A92E3|nr:MFS transporter [Pseudonocardia sp. Ae707_Ps1]OLM15954.1 putative integral membrane transporter [Pseudonocardia sp. Ae707_Ps1]
MSIAEHETRAEETIATGSSEQVDRSRRAALVGSPLLVVGVALAASNLRPAVTSMASVLGEVRDDLGAAAAWTSVLTAVPTICFGLAAIAAPWLGRRFGMARAIGIALTVLTAGLVLRIVDGPWVVLGGTFVAAAGIAIGNVLIPVVVKESFPHAVGRVTGVYTAALAAGGGIGAAFTPPLEPLLGGWRGAVGAWALLSAAALVVWLCGARHGRAEETTARSAEPRRSMLRRPLAWAVTAFFGLQACVAYVAMGWLSELFVSEGIPRTDAGLMLALINLIGIPLSFIVPPIALNRPSQSWWIVGLACCSLAAVAGLAVAPAAAPWLWTVLLGTGMAVFPLGLGVIALRTREASETTDLSAMAQGVGYLIGATGPFLFGMLHGVTGTWTASLVLLGAVIVVEMVVGWIAGRPRFV